ncbi:Hypothetical_protein [Hexamita inflata]|uniref:Hypothetical_protein n=1 Tax=Hexamita inflata TaxID=28002 RepID=A0AA86PBP9_9EUKA|nr:Hypothetical protein HINF_LOCUS23451 [Hexamita inflata]
MNTLQIATVKSQYGPTLDINPIPSRPKVEYNYIYSKGIQYRRKIQMDTAREYIDREWCQCVFALVRDLRGQYSYIALPFSYRQLLIKQQLLCYLLMLEVSKNYGELTKVDVELAYSSRPSSAAFQ